MRVVLFRGERLFCKKTVSSTINEREVNDEMGKNDSEEFSNMKFLSIQSKIILEPVLLH